METHTVDEVPVGTRVAHGILGEGVVTAIGELSGEPSITINFRQVGEKKLLLRFAKLKILK